MWAQGKIPYHRQVLKCFSSPFVAFLTLHLKGFWDYEAGRENNDDAYANSLGRVDVEGW